jgi:hypothetical protein
MAKALRIWPSLAPEEGEFRVPHRPAGLWEGAGSARSLANLIIPG